MQAALILSTLCYFAWPAVSSYADFVPTIPARCVGLPSARTLKLRGGEGAVVPGVAWSQRADSLLFKVDMPPGKHSAEGLEISDTHVTWKDAGVDLDIAFFAAVNSKAATTFSDGGRQIKITVPKLESSWWPRLTTGPKPFNVKIDWASWKDENEAETRKYSAGTKFKDDDFNYDDAAKDDPSPWTGNDDKEDDGKDEEENDMPDEELKKAMADGEPGKAPEEVEKQGGEPAAAAAGGAPVESMADA